MLESHQPPPPGPLKSRHTIDGVSPSAGNPIWLAHTDFPAARACRGPNVKTTGTAAAPPTINLRRAASLLRSAESADDPSGTSSLDSVKETFSAGSFAKPPPPIAPHRARSSWCCAWLCCTKSEDSAMNSQERVSRGTPFELEIADCQRFLTPGWAERRDASGKCQIAGASERAVTTATNKILAAGTRQLDSDLDNKQCGRVRIGARGASRARVGRALRRRSPG